MDDRIKLIEHQGSQILWIDLSHCAGDELADRVARAAEVIRNSPELSILTLTLLHGVTYDKETITFLSEYVRENGPYVRAGAVVGLDYLSGIILPVNRVTGRQLQTFANEDAAKDWLVEESKRPPTR